MKLTVLVDNLAGGIFGAEHGLSYFIESSDKTVLLDTGHSDLFLKNAEKLGINLLKEVDQIVLSHGHWDHGNGLKFIKNKPLLTHPGSFIKRYRKKDRQFIGLNLLPDEIKKRFQLKVSAQAKRISSTIYFLGEIPRTNHFEAKKTSFMDEFENDDFVPDDSALAIVENNELIIVSGCSHSGICNICEYAKQITRIPKIKAVIGGFHLKENDFQTKETIRYFKKENVQHLFPSHCTGFEAMNAIYNVFKISRIKTGDQLQF